MPAMLLNPFCPLTTAKVLALKATVLVLLTLLIKARVQIVAGSALGIALLLLQVLVFLAVAVVPGNQRLEVGNDSKGHDQLVRWLARLPVSRILLESTGGYEQTVAVTLSAHWPVVRIAGHRARAFAVALGRIAKTDPIDAATLAQLAAIVEGPVMTPPSPEEVRLQALVRRREQLVGQRDDERRRLHQATETFVRQSLQRQIKHLQGEIARLDREIEACVPACGDERAARLRAVPGVGAVTVATLLAFLPELGQLENRQISAGVPTQAQQAQAMPAHLKKAGLQFLGRQHHLGAAHPVADQAVHVLRHGLALLVEQAAGAGQGGYRHVGEGLVAEGVVGVVVGQQQLQHGLVGDPSNGLAHGFAVAFRGAAVDHHYALLCDDKPGIDDIAAIALGEVVGAALQQPDAVGDLPGLQLIIQLGLGRAKRQA